MRVIRASVLDRILCSNQDTTTLSLLCTIDAGSTGLAASPYSSAAVAHVLASALCRLSTNCYRVSTSAFTRCGSQHYALASMCSSTTRLLRWTTALPCSMTSMRALYVPSSASSTRRRCSSYASSACWRQPPCRGTRPIRLWQRQRLLAVPRQPLLRTRHAQRLSLFTNMSLVMVWPSVGCCRRLPPRALALGRAGGRVHRDCARPRCTIMKFEISFVYYYSCIL